MRAVEMPEQPGMVHEAVRPVEIGIMRDDDRGENQQIQAQTKADAEDIVEHPDLAAPDHEAGPDHIDKHRLQRLGKFAAHIGNSGLTRLDLARFQGRAPQPPHKREGERGGNQITGIG